MISHKAGSIGCCARQFLENTPSAAVSGATSRGIFLRTPEQKIIFLSYERYHSPVTINLPAEAAEDLQQLEIDERAMISPAGIRLPSCGVHVNFATAAIWQPSPVPAAAGRQPDVIDRLQQLCRLCTQKNSNGFSALLKVRLALLEAGQLTHEAALAYERSVAFIDALQTGQVHSAAACLEKLLGMGRGLTPSGDDFVEGLLLVLKRWQASLHFAFDLRELSEMAAAAARRTTTALSATLIECAAMGGADQRLVEAADYIFSAQPPLRQAADGLLSLGSSSGIDALLGMAAALDVSSL